jgi:glucose/arabinose dehydrogenase
MLNLLICSVAFRACAAIAVLAVAIGIAPGAALAQGAAVRIASGLDSPIYTAAPAGDPRLFIVERGGTIRVFQNGSVLPGYFLDISDRVVLPLFQSEAGLLSMAFAPDYPTSGVFYVYYTGAPDEGVGLEKRVARFIAANPASSGPVSTATEAILFRLVQSAPNHIGGTIAIRDGFLYLGLGDAGTNGDAAQDDGSPLGKFIRFDTSQTQLPWDYELWAKGFRNPFRWSFDRSTGDLYIGDVGQQTWEEIDVQAADSPAGLNYGWDVMEGTSCFDPKPSKPPCNDPSLLLPVYEYPNSDPINTCAVTGGSVYRGSLSQSLRGVYFFIDLCQGRLMSLRWDPITGTAFDVVDRTDEFPTNPPTQDNEISQPVAISEDGFGELYVVSLQGSVYKLVPEPGASLLGAAALATLAGVARRRSV